LDDSAAVAQDESESFENEVHIFVFYDYVLVCFANCKCMYVRMYICIVLLSDNNTYKFKFCGEISITEEQMAMHTNYLPLNQTCTLLF